MTENITRKIMRIWENLKNKYKHTKTKSVKDWLIVHIIGYIMHSTVTKPSSRNKNKQVEITQPLCRSTISQHLLSSVVVGNKKDKKYLFPFCSAQKMSELFSFPSDCNPEIVPPPIFSPSMTLSFSHLLSTLPKVFVCQNKKLHFLEYQKNVFFVAISHC